MVKLAHTPPKKLFALLRYLDVDQNTLAAHLGVSHTLVSFWARGKKPVPQRHKDMISALVGTAIDAFVARHSRDMEQAEQQYRRLTSQGDPPSEDLDAAMLLWNTAIDTCQAAIATLRGMIREWAIEEDYRSGKLTGDLYRACRIVGEYGARQPQPLPPEDQQILENAAREVLQQLQDLKAIDSTPAQLLERLDVQQPEGHLRAV